MSGRNKLSMLTDNLSSERRSKIEARKFRLRESKLETLRTALVKGEASGIDADYSIDTRQHELDSQKSHNGA